MGLITQAVLALSLGVSGWTPGRVVYYDKGLMETVAARRSLSVVPCMVAHPTAPIGTWLIIRSARVQLRCRVTDTSQPEDRQRHIRMGLIELDYASAHRICPPGWQGAAKECMVRVR